MVFTCSFIACNDSNDDNDTIEVNNADELTQNYYAQDKKESTVSFVTTDVWSANTDAEWIVIDKKSGEAGINNVKITVLPNYTGKERNAEIIITCLNSKITVNISQDFKDENGKEAQKVISKINYIHTNENHSYNFDYNFIYDDKCRLTKIEVKDNTSKLTHYGTITYEDNKVVCELVDEESSISVANLNDKGYVVSGTYTKPTGKDEFVVTYTNDYLNSVTKNGIKELFIWKNGNLETLAHESKYAKYTSHAIYNDEILNKANLDLNWFIYNDEFLSLVDETFFDILELYGKRSKNMVKTNYLLSDEHEDSRAEYTYVTDDEGYVIKCDMNGTFSTESITITY